MKEGVRKGPEGEKKGADLHRQRDRKGREEEGMHWFHSLWQKRDRLIKGGGKSGEESKAFSPEERGKGGGNREELSMERVSSGC